MEKNEKFLNYSDEEMGELKALISKYFESLKKQFAPGLDLFLIPTVEKHANKFLLEQKAVYLLDQKSIENGFESAADEQYQIAKAERERVAAEKAAVEALEKAEAAQKAKELADQIEVQRVLQSERDKEDAKLAAEILAKRAAEAKGLADAEANV